MSRRWLTREKEESWAPSDPHEAPCLPQKGRNELSFCCMFQASIILGFLLLAAPPDCILWRSRAEAGRPVWRGVFLQAGGAEAGTMPSSHAGGERRVEKRPFPVEHLEELLIEGM